MSIFPVQIISNPSSQKVISGQTATFSVIVEGAGTLYYMWSTSNERILNESALAYSNSILSPIEFFQIGSGFIEPAGIIPGATNPTYTTPVLQASDTGSQFTCYVIQLVAISQSVGGPNVTNTPQAKVVQTFSFATSSAAVVTVTPGFTFSDNFQRANEDPLTSTKWIPNTDGFDQLQVSSNQCEDDGSVSAGLGEMFINASFPANQFCFVTIGAVSTGEYFIVLRAQGYSFANSYYVNLGFLGGHWFLTLLKSVASVAIQLGQVTLLQAPQVGDIFGIEVTGTSFSVLYNGQSMINVTDSTFSSGNVGIVLVPDEALNDTTVTLVTAGSL